MGWTSYQDGKKRKFSVDYGVVADIAVAYSYMRALTENSSVQPGPYTLLGRAGKEVVFNHQSVRQAKTALINSNVPFALQVLGLDGYAGMRLLANWHSETLSMRGTMAKRFSDADKATRKFNSGAEAAVVTAQLVRDGGFATLAVVGGMAGGGVALAAAGLSAAGQGIGKYQDSGSASAACWAAASSLVMLGVGKVGGEIVKAGASSKKVVVACSLLIDANLEVLGAQIEGKSGSEAIQAGVIKAGAGAAAELAEVAAPLLKEYGGRMAKFIATLTKADESSTVNAGLAAGKKFLGALSSLNQAHVKGDNAGAAAAMESLKQSVSKMTQVGSEAVIAQLTNRNEAAVRARADPTALQYVNQRALREA